MTIASAHCSPCTPAASRRSLVQLAAARVSAWRQRRVLARLDDIRLADIGVSRKEALEESRRSFWDAPENWKR